MDLMVDDSDGVVLGALRIPPLSPSQGAGAGQEPVPDAEDAAGRPWLRTCQSLVRTLVPASRPLRPVSPPEPGPSRLRVEVDGQTLVDLNQPVEAVSVAPSASGVASVEVRPVSVGAEASPLLAEGRTVTVSGAHFRYRADSLVSGPVRTRTWVVREGAWSLTVPAGA
jgi:hypothetical protein